MSSAPAAQLVAPDLVEPLVGYRCWTLDRGELRSPFLDYRWARGVNVAGCAVRCAHAEPAPDHRCRCGLHAWYRPCPRLGYAVPDLVAGAVALWGPVELHRRGMRARYATIVALVLPVARGKRRRVWDLARAFEVDVVPARQLVAAAREHGAPPSSDLLPLAD